MRARAISSWLMVAILPIALMASCRPQEEPTPTPIPTPIVPEKPIYVVQRGTVVKSIHFTGRVVPVREEKLFFKTSGYIKRMFVKKGDAVKEGDLLAELEMGDLERQLSQAELDLEIAQLRKREAERANRYAIAQAKIALERALEKLSKLKAGPDPVAVQEARLNLEIAKNQLWSAQIYRDAICGQKGREWECAQAEAAVGVAEAAVRRAQIKLEEVLAGPSDYEIKMAELEVESAKLTLKQLEEGPDPLLAKEVERANLTLQWLRAQANDARIFAPFDGQVMSVAAYPGKYIEAFKPVIILADLTSLEISAELSGEELGKISEGLPATIVLADYPGRELKGKVRRLPYPFGAVEAFEEADRSVRISFDPEGLKLEVGALAKVTIEIERKENVLYLPPAAIRTFSGRKFVVVKDGEIQRRVDVKLGIEGEDRVEIIEGLEEGQIVVGQ